MQSVTTTTFAIKQFICRSLFVAAIVVGASFGIVQNVHAYGWTIDRFDSVIVVNEDATLSVTETISVDFDVDKHGIYREIPIFYVDKLNNRVRANVTNIEVLQDGADATFVVNILGPDKVIRIGDADTLITGAHEYVISYNVKRAILYFDDYDEVYWNVTGSDWDVPITASSAVVELPEGASVEHVACYTGAYGSVDQGCGIAENGNIVGFAAEDFLTVAVGFTKNVVYQPTIWDKIRWFVFDNWIGLFPIVFMIATFYLWWRMGRDPKLHKTVIAEYEPPGDLWAAYASLLLHGSVSKQAVTAMILQLAVKGYIRIEVTEGKKKKNNVTTLRNLKSRESLDEPHKKLMGILFGSHRKSTTLKELQNRVTALQISNLRKSLYKKLQKDKLFTSSSFRLRTLVLVLAVIQLYAAVMLGFFFGLFAGTMLFVSGMLGIIFGLLMPKRTLKGAELALKVAGFKLFMHTAERYRSVWQEKQDIFFEYLPYAIVFKDTKRWARVFDGLDFARPDWYKSSLPLGTSLLFINEIGSFSKSFATAATPKPSSSGSYSGSSGSSSGGFSGGGFGGGGGGSW